MRRVGLYAVLAALAASTARANPGSGGPIYVFGADTMYGLTTDVIMTCNDPNPHDDRPGPLADTSSQPYPNLYSVGGGSRFGGERINPRRFGPAGDQQIAPMTRFLDSEECNADGTNRGQGIQIGLDGIGIFRDAREATQCQVVRYAGCMVVRDLNDRALLGYGNGAPGLDDGAGAPVPQTYCFTHWADVLRIVYTGQHSHLDNSGVVAACRRDAQSTEIGAKRCNSDVRRTLVESWHQLFDAPGHDGAGGCASTHCTRLRHAYRLDDYSGITETFLALIGAPALSPPGFVPASQRAFCNGLENEDLDPIRRPCERVAESANDPDSVCAPIPFRNRNAPFGPNGGPSGSSGTLEAIAPAAGDVSDLGLVLTISLPIEHAYQYDAAFCTSSPVGGAFRLAQMPSALPLNAQRCPDGNPRSGGQCRVPVYQTGPNAGRFNCRSRRTNRPGGLNWPNMDARAYNLVPRDAVTGAILQFNHSQIADPRWGGGGHYRISMAFAKTSQTATPWAASHPTCQRSDATNQIGCLVQADPCSIGFAGLEALDEQAGNAALMLRAALDLDTGESNSGDDLELGPTQAGVLRLLESVGLACESGSGNYDQRYPLAHALWLNASKGFGGFPGTLPNITNLVDTDPDNLGPFERSTPQNGPVQPDGVLDTFRGENDFARCYTNRAFVEPLLLAHGFFPLPEGYPESSRLRQCP